MIRKLAVSLVLLTSTAAVAQEAQAPMNTQTQPSRSSESTSGDANSRLPAKKDTTANTPARAEPTPQPTDKMTGEGGNEMKTAQSDMTSGSKSIKSTQHAAKSRSRSHQTAMSGDKAYQDALRNCAKQQDRKTRDKCLDNAIEQFHRNT